jgi:hypothetical protein
VGAPEGAPTHFIARVVQRLPIPDTVNLLAPRVFLQGRALIHTMGDMVTGVSKRARQQRVKSLNRLFEIFEGNDAAEEVRRLKMEDQGF